MNGNTVDVAIVGSGFAGLGAAVKLDEAGRRDFVVLEKADSVGGTWRDNTYPGCACDVQSHLYSFSFAPNPNWSRLFARQPEPVRSNRDQHSQLIHRHQVRAIRTSLPEWQR